VCQEKLKTPGKQPIPLFASADADFVCNAINNAIMGQQIINILILNI
jgi:hypothetical protein